MINRSGPLGGSAWQARPLSTGQNVKVLASSSTKHELHRSSPGIAAAAVAVHCSPRQQASDSNLDSEARLQAGATPLLRAQQGVDQSATLSGQQQNQQWLISNAPPAQQQQDWLQQYDSYGSSDTISGGQPLVAVLGSRPGVIWHTRRKGRSIINNSTSAHTRGLGVAANGLTASNNSSSHDWNMQHATAAILDAFGSMDFPGSTGTSSSSSRSNSRTPSVQATVGEADHTAELQQLEQQQQLLQQAPGPAPPCSVDYDLLDRQLSHGFASSSGRSGSTATRSTTSSTTSSDWLSVPSISNGSSIQGDNALEGQSHLRESSGTTAAAAAAVVDGDMAYLQQGPAANFRDPRFEMAISRWVKEAPDWFKVRTVFDRFGWRFNIVNLSCTLQKLAMLLKPLSVKRPLREEQRALRKFLRQVFQAVGPLLPSADGSTAAALLSSYARLLQTRQVFKDPQFIDSLLEHIRPQLSTLKPNELTGCLWALKTAHHTPADDWLSEMYEQTEVTICQLRPDEVAVMLRGLAGLQSGPPKSSWLSAVLAHAEAQLDQMEPERVAMMLTGLANMQVQLRRSWTDAVLAAVRSRFSQMGPQALSNILWALAKMNCLPDRPWLNSYFSTTLELFNVVNPTELSVVGWSVNKLKLEPNDEWLNDYFDESEAKLPRFTLQNLALCGYSLAKLGLRPPQTWLRRYCTLLLRLKGGLWKNKVLLTQVLVALDSFKVPRMDMWRRELYAAAGYKLYKYPDWRQRVKVMPSPSGPYSMLPFASNRRRFGRRGLGGSRAASHLSSVLSRRSDTALALRSGDWGVMDSMGGSIGVRGSSMSSYEELGSVRTPVITTAEPFRSESARENDASSATGSLGSVTSSLGSLGSVWGSSDDSGADSRDGIGQSSAGKDGFAGQRIHAGPATAAGAGGASVASTAAKASARMLTSKGWVGGRSGTVQARRPLSGAGLVRPPSPVPPPALAGEMRMPPLPSAAAPAAESPDLAAGSRLDGLGQGASVKEGGQQNQQHVDASTSHRNGRQSDASTHVE